MLSLPSPSALTTLDQDLLDQLLRDKRSPNTRRTYARDLKNFRPTGFADS